MGTLNYKKIKSNKPKTQKIDILSLIHTNDREFPLIAT